MDFLFLFRFNLRGRRCACSPCSRSHSLALTLTAGRTALFRSRSSFLAFTRRLLLPNSRPFRLTAKCTMINNGPRQDGGEGEVVSLWLCFSFWLSFLAFSHFGRPNHRPLSTRTLAQPGSHSHTHTHRYATKTTQSSC